MRYAPHPQETETGPNSTVPDSHNATVNTATVNTATVNTASASTASTSAAVSEIGYAVGKKVGNAVVRNRIRRRLRPIVAAEAELPESGVLEPGIYLIGVKSGQAAWISYEELRDDLRNTLESASRARR